MRLKHEAMCLNKKGYSTEMFAMGVAHACAKKRDVHLRAYRCPSCYQWHLTKSIDRKKRK